MMKIIGRGAISRNGPFSVFGSLFRVRKPDLKLFKSFLEGHGQHLLAIFTTIYRNSARCRRCRAENERISLEDVRTRSSCSSWQESFGTSHGSQACVMALKGIRIATPWLKASQDTTFAPWEAAKAMRSALFRASSEPKKPVAKSRRPFGARPENCPVQCTPGPWLPLEAARLDVRCPHFLARNL